MGDQRTGAERETRSSASHLRDRTLAEQAATVLAGCGAEHVHFVDGTGTPLPPQASTPPPGRSRGLVVEKRRAWLIVSPPRVTPSTISDPARPGRTNPPENVLKKQGPVGRAMGRFPDSTTNAGRGPERVLPGMRQPNRRGERHSPTVSQKAGVWSRFSPAPVVPDLGGSSVSFRSRRGIRKEYADAEAIRHCLTGRSAGGVRCLADGLRQGQRRRERGRGRRSLLRHAGQRRPRQRRPRRRFSRLRSPTPIRVVVAIAIPGAPIAPTTEEILAAPGPATTTTAATVTTATAPTPTTTGTTRATTTAAAPTTAAAGPTATAGATTAAAPTATAGATTAATPTALPPTTRVPGTAVPTRTGTANRYRQPCRYYEDCTQYQRCKN